MASGDTLWVLLPTDNEPPASGYATFDIRNGHPVLDCSDTADEACVFSFVLPRSYGGGGLAVHLHYSMASAVSGKIRLDASFERIGIAVQRSEEHTSELQSLMRISYAVFCLKKKTHYNTHTTNQRSEPHLPGSLKPQSTHTYTDDTSTIT